MRYFLRSTMVKLTMIPNIPRLRIINPKTLLPAIGINPTPPSLVRRKPMLPENRSEPQEGGPCFHPPFLAPVPRICKDLLRRIPSPGRLKYLEEDLPSYETEPLLQPPGLGGGLQRRRFPLF